MKKTLLLTIFMLVCSLNYAQTVPKTPEEESNSSIEMGNIKAENGDWKGALNDYTNALGYNKKNQAAYYHRALAEQNLRDYRNAIMDYSRAIYLNDSDGDSYYGRGICYNFMGSKEKCCFDLTKAMEFGNQDASIALSNYCN